MRANRSFFALIVSSTVLLAIAFTVASVAASHGFRSKSPRSAMAANSSTQANQVQVLNAGLWRTDSGFNATIRVTNLLVVGPLEVVPVLYMADGTRYELPPLKLPTSGESNVNVNDALRSAPPAVAAHLSEFGSTSLEYHYAFPGVAAATVQILDVPRSLIFIYCFGPSGGVPGPHTVEGVWWKHDPDITGFVGLTNTTSHALEAKLALIDANGDASGERSFTLDGRTVKLVDLEEMCERIPSRPKGRGGIRVRYEGASGDLLVTGGLQNDAIGYSATIPFFFGESAPVEVAPHTYASVGMMIGKPDPMMGFPATTRFAPYAVIRNTTGDRLPVTSSIVYTNMGQPVTVPLPLKSLRPLSTEEIDLKALMSASGLGSFDGLINLTFTFNGRPGDLLISTGSVDQTGTYVFAVQPEATKRSSGKEIAFWSVADGSDTMISLWNPLNAAQDMAVTFRYADGSGEYRLPVHLAAKADAMISVAELMMMGQPDLNGNTFSATAQEGSAALTNLADPHGDLTVVVSAGTFNVRTATCGGGCTLCSGLSSVIVSGAGSVAVGSTAQFSATAYYSNGSSSDVTFGALWATSNSSVASVNATGNVSGVAPGSAWITASYDGRLGGVCPIPPTYDGGCPAGTLSDSLSVNTTPRIDSISPSRGLIGATTSVTLSGRGFGTSPSVSAGSGITVTINSASDVQIQASFAVSSTATSGNNSVTVTASSQPSNSVNFFVQVPSSLSIAPGTSSTTAEAACSAGSFGTGCGVTRSFMYQVNDQAGQPVQVGGLQVWDAIQTTSPNNLGITSYNTTCTPANTGPCGVTTNSNGQFGENSPGLSVCSTVCRSNNMCITGGPTNATQTVHVGSYTIAQNLSYYCDHINVNGQ